MENKKVGILSFFSSDENYGQLLQIYASCTILRKIGYDPYVINYKANCDRSLQRSLSKKILSNLFNYKKILAFLRALIYSPKNFIDDNQQRKFKEFRETRLQWTRKYETFAELKENYPDFHAYIVGSDIVWSSPNLYEAYYLHFGDDKIKKISYAASFGSSEIGTYYKKRLLDYIKPLDRISTREDTAREIVQSVTGREVKWVPDPTLLLNSGDYREIQTEKITTDEENQFVFTYLLGNGIHLRMKDIEDFAVKNNLKIKYTTAHGRTDEYTKIYPTIEEWLELVDKAKFVITNSFHGVAFCIIYHKAFLYVPIYYNEGKTNTRAFSLLNRLGLQNRIWKGDMEGLKNPIDYDKVETILNPWKEEAIEFLKEGIK